MVEWLSEIENGAEGEEDEEDGEVIRCDNIGRGRFVDRVEDVCNEFRAWNGVISEDKESLVGEKG
jgi:hypothetical protein